MQDSARTPQTVTADEEIQSDGVNISTTDNVGEQETDPDAASPREDDGIEMSVIHTLQITEETVVEGPEDNDNDDSSSGISVDVSENDMSTASFPTPPPYSEIPPAFQEPPPAYSEQDPSPNGVDWRDETLPCTRHRVLACFVLWLCGILFGLVAYELASKSGTLRAFVS